MNTKQKIWTQVEFTLPEDREEMASWLMMQFGATGCATGAIDNTNTVRLQASFKKSSLDDSEIQSIKAALEEYGLSQSLQSFCIKELVEEDWLIRFKEGLEPFDVGERLTICPPWAKAKLSPAQKQRKVIYIEPGMAFGTGLHITTRFCLQAIESDAQQVSSALDVGTGSGILAIAQTLLNEKCATIAVDTNEQAITNAQSNLELNGASKQVRLLLGSTDAIQDQKFDRIFSNLTAEDIIALLPEYERLLARGGSVICAGIIEERLPLLTAALAARGWKILKNELNNGWAGLIIGR